MTDLSTGRRIRPLGPILILAGVAAAVLGVFLSWRPLSDGIRDLFGYWSGFDVMTALMQMGQPMGVVLVISFIAMGVVVVFLLIGFMFALAGGPPLRWATGLTLWCAIGGFVASVGVLVGFASFGALSGMGLGGVVYSLSGVAMLVGAVGVATRRF